MLAGLAGGLYVHLLPLNTESVYLDLTFITLAMLVIGGATSLWGAVVGALAVSALDSYLAVAENGTSFFGWHIDLPAGTRVIVVGALMAVVLILRPSGLTGGREFQPAVAAMTRVCVAGAGVIGSLFAAHLARVAEVSALARREEHARALERARAARQRPRPTSRRALAAATTPDALPEPELVIVACKGADLDAVAARLAGSLARRDRDDRAERDRRGRGRSRAHGDWRAALGGHVHERDAPRGHARRVRARHRDLDRPVRAARRPPTPRRSRI